MKTEAKRFPVQTLYVLGAGASHALSYVKPHSLSASDHDDRDDKYKLSTRVTPLDAQFIRALRDRNISTGWRSRSFAKVQTDWLDFQEFPRFGLEEAIIRRVSQYDFLSNIHSNRSTGKSSNEKYLNHLSHLISEYLLKCRSNASGRTKKFVNSVFPESENAEQFENRIITFNYDILLERVLLERSIERQKIYFDGITREQTPTFYRRQEDKFVHPLVLKLHGSVDWRCGRGYFEDIISGDVQTGAKVPIWSHDERSPEPDDDISPLIIPPIPNKPITKAGIFKYLWTLAYEYLHQASKIVIVGYSCPQTDTLARTMFSHFRNRRVAEITIVDPDPLALSRYKKMIRTGKTQKVIWKYFSSFEEYIDIEL